MHPILARKQWLALYVLAWTLLGGLQLAGLLAQSRELAWGEALALALPLAFVYGFVCLTAWYVCRTIPLRESSFVQLLVTHVAAASLSSGLWVVMGRGWAEALSSIPALATVGSHYLPQAPSLFVVGVLLYLLAVAVHYVLLEVEASRSAEMDGLTLKVLAREAELRALRAQIDPHFLFNSLHSISALTSADPTGARRMCVLLADFLRDSLSLGSDERIALAREISLIQRFLAIEQVRFGPRLSVATEIEPGCETCLVPPLLLQPLVENAVTHGIASLIDGGTIRIEAHRHAGRLEVVIENPCDPDLAGQHGSGLGLDNVRRRLATLFAGNARLNVRDIDGRFRVELDLAIEPPGEPAPQLPPDAPVSQDLNHA